MFCLYIGFRIGYIQIIEGKQWRTKATKKHIFERVIDPIRGNIYSYDGELLATSLPFYRVALDPCIASRHIFYSGINQLSHLLSQYYTTHSPHYFSKKITLARDRQKRYIILSKKYINHHQKKAMGSWPIFNAGRWQGGVIFEKKEKRFYPFGKLGLRTIGFINENDKGVGIEYSLHNHLKGIPGKGKYQKFVGNHWKLIKDKHTVHPIHGSDIVTTLNIHLQDQVHHILLHALKKHKARYGCAIVMEVHTGAIKAVANLSKTADNKYQEDYNYAWGNQGNREPGSTFKLATMMAILEEKKLSPHTIVDTGLGKKKFYDQTMKDIKRGGHGKITVKEVFEKSSNIGIALLVEKYFKKQPQKFLNYLQHFGLQSALDMNIKGIGIPIIKQVEDTTWSGITLPWMSMGYELKLTPLHLLALYNAVANNGIWVSPVLISKIQMGSILIKKFSMPVKAKKICSQHTVTTVKKMLEGVVQCGTAMGIKNSFYPIAGKSGTAQRIEKGRYTKSWYTSFAGYFPAHNPKYSCIVCIDNPQGKNKYGSNVAAPVFKKIADSIAVKDIISLPSEDMNIAQKKNIFPHIKVGKKNDLLFLCKLMNIPFLENNAKDIWVRAIIKNKTLHWKKHALLSENTMPSVIGMTLKDALYILENRGIKVNFQGRGRVYQQSIKTGSPIQENLCITLYLQ